MDNLETNNERKLIPGIGFYINSSIYLSDFGIEIEINMIVGNGFPVVNTQPVQNAIVSLRAD